MSVLEPVRVLVIPGLPDLEAWSACIVATLASRPGRRWVAVAHSFGCLALAHHLAQGTAAAYASAISLPAGRVDACFTVSTPAPGAECQSEGGPV